MIRRLLIGALVCLTAPVLAAQDIAGDWQGTLRAGGAELHLVLHIERAANGALKASLDSTDQNALGIPVTSIIFDHAKLALRVDSVGGTYEGILNGAATEIDGTWSQGQPLALNFRRAASPPTP
jgi:hypothetical protein